VAFYEVDILLNHLEPTYFIKSVYLIFDTRDLSFARRSLYQMRYQSVEITLCTNLLDKVPCRNQPKSESHSISSVWNYLINIIWSILFDQYQ